MTSVVEIIAHDQPANVTIVKESGSERLVVTDPAREIETVDVLGRQGPRGFAGESGLLADVPTDFSLIYRLST